VFELTKLDSGTFEHSARVWVSVPLL